MLRSQMIALVATLMLATSTLAGDFTDEVFLEDGRLRHDVQAALGHERLAKLLDEPDRGVVARLRRRAQGEELDWDALVRSARRRVVRDLIGVASGADQPYRAYLDSRFDGTRIRDEILDVERRSNVRAVLGGFHRYNADDEARIDQLNDLVGQGVVESVCAEAAEWAGFHQVSLLAKLAVGALAREQAPDREQYDATGEQAYRDAVERARRALAGVAAARNRPLPPYLAVDAVVEHGGFLGDMFSQMSGEGPSPFLGPEHAGPLTGSGIFGLPDA